MLEPITNPIRAWREHAGLSQYALAARLNEAGHKVTRATVGFWENGDRTPQLLDVVAIATIMGKNQGEAEAAFLAIHRARGVSCLRIPCELEAETANMEQKMTEQFKAAFPAVDWRWDSETGGLSGRNRRTWVYVRPYRGGYQAWAELEHRGEGWSLIPEEAVQAALTDLGDKTRAWADRVADALGNWGKP